MATKALSYLRVSGKGQVQGDGFPRQREAIARYAKAHNVGIVAEYRDEGVSGAKELADRDGLSDLLVHVKSNGVRLVLVERADRLARDLMVSELLLKEFRDLGVGVVAAESGTELTTGDDDPTKTLIRQVLAAVAEFDKSSIVIKLRAARRRKSKALGRSCEGRKAFGYYEGEDATLERMRALYRKPRGGKRLGFYQIATVLNSEGLASRTGKPWTGTSVKRILERRTRKEG